MEAERELGDRRWTSWGGSHRGEQGFGTWERRRRRRPAGEEETGVQGRADRGHSSQAPPGGQSAMSREWTAACGRLPVTLEGPEGSQAEVMEDGRAAGWGQANRKNVWAPLWGAWTVVGRDHGACRAPLSDFHVSLSRTCSLESSFTGSKETGKTRVPGCPRPRSPSTGLDPTALGPRDGLMGTRICSWGGGSSEKLTASRAP